MNEQKQQFGNPGTIPGDRHPINTDPREQPQWQNGQPLFTQRPPRQGPSPWRWFALSLAILLVIFGGLATLTAMLTHEVTTTRSFTVGDQPKLVLTANSGDIHIINGPNGQITVAARQRVFVGDNDPLPVHYNQSSDGNTVTVSIEDTFTFVIFSAGRGLDFDITVPTQTALTVHTSSGSISALGVQGQMSLTTSSGDITTDGGSGQITLKTSAGDIKASNISGQMTLSTSSGDVTATNASASGNSSFQSSSGDITYRGSLAPNGTYDFHASSGNIDLTLRDTAFQVQSQTSSGDITSDFSGVILQHTGSGAKANGTVGNAPYAQITIMTTSGDIHLRQA